MVAKPSAMGPLTRISHRGGWRHFSFQFISVNYGLIAQLPQQTACDCRQPITALAVSRALAWPKLSSGVRPGRPAGLDLSPCLPMVSRLTFQKCSVGGDSISCRARYPSHGYVSGNHQSLSPRSPFRPARTLGLRPGCLGWRLDVGRALPYPSEQRLYLAASNMIHSWTMSRQGTAFRSAAGFAPPARRRKPCRGGYVTVIASAPAPDYRVAAGVPASLHTAKGVGNEPRNAKFGR